LVIHEELGASLEDFWICLLISIRAGGDEITRNFLQGGILLHPKENVYVTGYGMHGPVELK
jgi:hypothetical protein